MKRINVNICALLVLTLAACTKSDVVDSAPTPSNTITFSAADMQLEVISRGGDKRPATLDITNKAIASEDGELSLPMVVKVEEGIHRAIEQKPATRAAAVTDANQISMLSAWASAKKGDVSELYIDDLDFTKGDDRIFRSNPAKLWLDAQTTLDFFVVANHIDAFTPNFNAVGDHIESFDYTVPIEAANQPDLLVAEKLGVAGNYEESVPLDFKHVLAAVNIKVGSEVATGTIQSIKFKGVYNKGTYLLDEHQWVNLTIDNAKVFSVPLPAGGVAITKGEGAEDDVSTTSFMMIPQQLATGAEVEVIFHDNALNRDVTLRASIQSDIWAMNTTTNYLININGDYGLEIIPLDKVIDSHYVITKVEISSDYPIWELNVSTNDSAEVTIQKESEVNTLAKQGFWTDKVVTKSGTEYVITGESARGTAKCSGSSSVSGQIFYVFIPENVSGAVREITLTLIGAGSESAASKTLTLEQHSVKWIDPTGKGNADEYWGTELLLEGGQVNWGFCWDGLNATFVVKQGGGDNAYNENTDTYSPSQVPAGQRKQILPAMELAGIDVIKMSTVKYDDKGKEIPNPDHDPDYYIQLAASGQHQYFIKIDLSKVGNIGVAEDYNNGWQNTDELYHFEGIGVLSQLIEFCKSWGDITNPDGRANMLQNSLDYAAMYAMKRNKFYYYEGLIPDVGNMIIPVIFDSDINWYLPAKGQFPTLMQSDWGQVFNWNDSYWTSTAYLEDSSDYSKSYAYINGAETIAYRKDKYLTMALRRKTETADFVINPDDVVIPGAGENGSSGSGGTTGGDTGGDQNGNT